MMIPQSRLMFLLVMVASAGLMLFSFFLQFVQNLEPCPLCISQRIAMALLGLLALVAVVHNPKESGFRCYGLFLGLLSLAGVLLASRQLWIQNLPSEKVPACMPGFEYLVDILPVTDIIRMMLTGTGDCAEIQWSFLGLSIPAWTLILFTVFLLTGFFELVRKRA